MIAEDEELTLQLIHQILDDAGYEVLPFAYNADDAIKKAMRYKPDLIILDINFSNDKQDGIFAADHIRRELDIPIVYVTGAVDQETVNRAKLTSPYSYVLKPVEKSKILIAIELAYHNWKVDQQLKEHEREIAESYIEGQDRQKIKLEDSLHEGIGVRLSTLGFYLSTLKDRINQLSIDDERLNDLLISTEGLLNESTSKLRQISFDLIPNTLLNYGLEAGLLALEKRLMEQSETFVVSIEFEGDWETEGKVTYRMPQFLELGIYWLIYDVSDFYLNKNCPVDMLFHILLTSESIEVSISELIVPDRWYYVKDGQSFISDRNIEARIRLLNARIENTNLNNQESMELSTLKLHIPKVRSLP